MFRAAPCQWRDPCTGMGHVEMVLEHVISEASSALVACEGCQFSVLFLP